MIDAYLTDRMMPVPDGCVLWTGSVNPSGYGKVGQAGPHQHKYAHRVVWELAHGPVPDGLELDHLCRVRSCVKLAHLEPVTHAVNMRRGMGMPDDGGLCRHGHGDWLRPWADGKRRCATCQKARSGTT